MPRWQRQGHAPPPAPGDRDRLPPKSLAGGWTADGLGLPLTVGIRTGHRRIEMGTWGWTADGLRLTPTLGIRTGDPRVVTETRGASGLGGRRPAQGRPGPFERLPGRCHAAASVVARGRRRGRTSRHRPGPRPGGPPPSVAASGRRPGPPPDRTRRVPRPGGMLGSPAPDPHRGAAPDSRRSRCRGAAGGCWGPRNAGSRSGHPSAAPQTGPRCPSPWGSARVTARRMACAARLPGVGLPVGCTCGRQHSETSRSPPAAPHTPPHPQFGH